MIFCVTEETSSSISVEKLFNETELRTFLLTLMSPESIDTMLKSILSDNKTNETYSLLGNGERSINIVTIDSYNSKDEFTQQIFAEYKYNTWIDEMINNVIDTALSMPRTRKAYDYLCKMLPDEIPRDMIKRLPFKNDNSEPTTLRRISKDQYYLNIAREVSKRSTCLRRCYGAVIVKNDEIIATGYNGAPRDCTNCCDKGACYRESQNIPHGEQYEKCVSVHAEQNAIISASRKDMIGSIMYLAGYDALSQEELDARPCLICSRMIINSGIKTIITKNGSIDAKELNLTNH